MRKSTIEHLPKEIEALIPESERTPLIKRIIEEAMIGEFHDFKNDKYVCGKMAVVSLMRETKDERLQPLINAVINGDYDEPADNNDVMNMRKDWTDSGSDPETFDKLFGGK
jgi:hypothetical protein